MDLIRLDNAPPTGTDESPPGFDVDIVAIHGLNGHFEKSWTDSESGILWLRDILPVDLPGSRVFSFNYDAKVFSNSAMKLDDYASKLLGSVSNARSSELEQNRPIFFVCHSLGGLVAKKALVLAREDTVHQNIVDETRGVAFFGTPHSGSLVADKAGPVASIYRSMFGEVRIDHLKTLAGRVISDELFSLNQSFRFLTSDRIMVSIYETRPTAPMNSIIVPRESALMNLPNEVQMPRDKDHRSLSKFASSDDDCYKELVTTIKTVLNSASSTTRRQSKDQSTLSRPRVVQALYVSEYENHRAAIEKPVTGTCCWILDNDAFRLWKSDGGSSTLWLSGGAGTGKSVLSAFIVGAQ